MRNIYLFAWIGMTDLRASRGEEADGAIGPIAAAATKRKYDKIYLLSNLETQVNITYGGWLEKRCHSKPTILYCPLSGPTEYGEIYDAVKSALDKIRTDSPNAGFEFHLSPGTPAMAAVWILLAKTIFPAVLIESMRNGTVREVGIPFDISAEYIPKLLKEEGDEIQKLTAGLPPESPEFDQIVFKCPEMKRVIGRARKLALYDVPVLITGESGTGKELFARAIHNSSRLSEGPFVAVNCGAIPENLFESEFFGYIKGAFTGAEKDKDGFMLSADKGTLFLDEIGELSLSSQVKLLRAIQEQSVMRIGSQKPVQVDIRILAATNRDLLKEVFSGTFREDLFHRLAVGVINIPPLRERRGDLGLLIESILSEVNSQCARQIPGWRKRTFSPSAKNLLLRHRWTGNIRELKNTISRVLVWSCSDSVSEQEVKDSLFNFPEKGSDNILNRDFNKDFNINSIICEVSSIYISKALEKTAGNKSQAAKLLGLSNYQTLDNWIKKYGT